MTEIETTIEIEAPVERVWQVLCDLPAYDEWNPFVTRARGTLRAGERFSYVATVRSREVPIDATLVEVEENREIRWKGPRAALLAKVFRGEHYFRLEPIGGTRTRFVHGERFAGAAIAVAWGRIRKMLEPAYVAMNEALKRRVEANLA